MPAYQDYLHLASNAEDFAVWTPDPELAGTCRRLAGSYCALVRFHDPCIVHHVCGTNRLRIGKGPPASQGRRNLEGQRAFAEAGVTVDHG